MLWTGVVIFLQAGRDDPTRIQDGNKEEERVGSG